MSSHREAPETAKDPAADNTDTYAFVSPDRPDFVTLIANFNGLQQPNGGPNYFEFGEDVVYMIHISNDESMDDVISYRFRFNTLTRNPNSFLYNTGPIDSIDSPNWNRPQFYQVDRVMDGKSTAMGRNLATPPVNVGKRSTPDYAKLSAQAILDLPNGGKVFAGQRADAFHVDLGSIFDLGALRPFNEAHLISMPNMNGVNSVQSYNVQTIAIQVPITELTKNGKRPTDIMDPNSTIGVWASARRRKSRIYDSAKGKFVGRGPFVQVSRLGNPLFNEVITPLGDKDNWNSREPRADAKFTKYVNQPELQRLLPALYPGVFPNLAKYNKPRADLNAILMTGIPAGVVPGFQNYTGPVQADVLRLNVAVPPSANPNDGGLVAGDPAGYPNGRRLNDDVVTIELRAVAGATIPLVDPDYKPDAAASAITDGTSNTNAAVTDSFPYLGLPGGGYQTVPGTTQAS